VRRDGPSQRKDPDPAGGYGPPTELRKLGTTLEAGKELQVGARAPSAASSSSAPLVGRSLGLVVGVHERRIEDDSASPAMWIGGLPSPASIWSAAALFAGVRAETVTLITSVLFV
jgi:hypothetical protein